MDESRTAHLDAHRHRVARESKVARRAQLCSSHWVQGSPLPPAAQAIVSLRYFHRHFHVRGDELSSLILSRFPCYEYTMNVFHQRYSSLCLSSGASRHSDNRV